MTRLITIPFSHFCEKARWALDACGVSYVEDGHIPVLHYAAMWRFRGRRTVPVLVADNEVIRDSTDIIAWADARRPGTLIPPSDAADALALEDDLDNHFGPATRRWGYYYLLPNRAASRALVADVPRWERVMLAMTRPLALGYLKRGLKIDAAGAARSHEKIEEAFARVGELLRDGRRYLVGDQFTVADLTFAALAAPVLLPPQHPKQAAMTLELFPQEARDQIAAWRATAAGQFALSLYARHRLTGEAASRVSA